MRVPGIDIFGSGYVLRGDDGWQITAEGREFLAMLEAVTQDNLPSEAEPELPAAPPADRDGRSLIVVGHRFRNRVHRPGTPPRKLGAVANTRRGENASS